MFLAFIARIWFSMFLKKNKSKILKIVFLENQTQNHAGAYYRVEILKEHFPKENCEINVLYAFKKSEFNAPPSLTNTLKHLYRKLHHIIATRNYDVVIVRRELLHQCQYGALVFEKLLLSIHPNAILDMDDYMPDHRKVVYSNSLFNRLGFYEADKTKIVIALFKYHTLATPEFKESMIEDFPGIASNNIHIFPMCLNYPDDKRKQYNQKNKAIGWVSRKGLFPRIDNLVDQFNEVYREFPFELVIIADAPYENSKLLAPVVNKTWSLESEVDDILSFDLGIAPIDVNPLFKNRIGTFKMVQYMSLGVVSVTTELAYSKRLIQDGVNGFLVPENQLWSKVLLKVLKHSPEEMSKIASKAYETFYSIHHIRSQASDLFNFYERVSLNSK